MSQPSSRRVLLLWLYAAALAHLIAGIALTWGGHTVLFDAYLRAIEQAFWASPPPPEARGQQVWWLAIFGATVQSYAIYMLALIHIAARHRIASIWLWLSAGLLLWAPQDTVVAWRAGVNSHLWINSAALLALILPMLALYRIDRAHARLSALQRR